MSHIKRSRTSSELCRVRTFSTSSRPPRGAAPPTRTAQPGLRFAPAWLASNAGRLARKARGRRTRGKSRSRGTDRLPSVSDLRGNWPDGQERVDCRAGLLTIKHQPQHSAQAEGDRAMVRMMRPSRPTRYYGHSGAAESGASEERSVDQSSGQDTVTSGSPRPTSGAPLQDKGRRIPLRLNRQADSARHQVV